VVFVAVKTKKGKSASNRGKIAMRVLTGEGSETALTVAETGREMKGRGIDGAVAPVIGDSVLAGGLEMFGWDRVDLKDGDAILERFRRYLEVCGETGMRPMVAGFAFALGLSFDDFYAILQGRVTSKTTDETLRILKKGHSFLRFSLEQFMIQDNGNPAKWIFLAKNYFGMKDQTETVITPGNPLGDAKSPEEIAEKYRLSLGDYDAKPQVI
jgi:hypothetical protein